MICIFCGKETKNIKFCNNVCQKEYDYHKYIYEWKKGLRDAFKVNIRFLLIFIVIYMKNIIIDVPNVVGEKKTI